jgi:hypothetical protein
MAIDDFLLSQMAQDDYNELIQGIREVSGELAPFDPYLHWSVNRREYFVEQSAVDLLAGLKAGLFIVRYHGVLCLARQFLNTRGWVLACVPLHHAQPDSQMLLTMMDGAA